jgi:hypothetical protein
LADALSISGSAPASISSGSVTRDDISLDDPCLRRSSTQAFTDLDPSAANDVYNEIDLQLWRDLPTIPLLQMPVTTIANNALQGLALTEPGELHVDAQNWSWELNAPPTVTTSTRRGRRRRRERKRDALVWANLSPFLLGNSITSEWRNRQTR